MTSPHESAPQTAGDGRDPVLDAGTYDRLREPRSDGRLPLGDGTWHQVSRKYVVVLLVSNILALVLVAAAAIVLGVVLELDWVWLPATAVAAFILFGLLIAHRQARSIGYQLRDDDLVFRRGILWQRIVAVPYGRMQLVDITHGPLDRGFGIAQLKLVTAAAATGVSIPGLTQRAAERLRDTLIEVAETRRTGL
ncbi:PH domain-containing protein [Microbacterium sp.]|uniref:PH domain-containing protein n=1 Tax=Microbacterium sp. TaxID=51671 RepID=UPI003A87D068